MGTLLSILRGWLPWMMALFVGLSVFVLPYQPAWSAAAKAPVETVAVMAPLEIKDNAQMNLFEQQLGQARAIGVNAVSVDVWWGKVEKNGDQQFDWSYYDTVFDKIQGAGLKIIPIISFHKCGGGPGDDCDIPLPGWLWSHFMGLGLSANDLKYESETGNIQEDAIAPWASATPAVLDEFRELMQAFAARYAPRAGHFAEINISLGPTGELRYPAYNHSDGWSYPDRGNFQAYSSLAQSDFRQWTLNRFGGLSGVANRWGIALGSPSEIRVPGGHLPPGSGRRAETFVQDNDHVDTVYGRDFIDWYNGSLVAHGRRLLEAANQAFINPMQVIPLGMKIPGVHWQMMPCAARPRIAEVTAGLVQTTLNLNPEPAARGAAYGYQQVLDMIASVKQQTGRDIILHFTAAEMDNDPACGPGNSMAQALVFWISQGAEDRHIQHKTENALACVETPTDDDRTWGSIRNVFSHAPYQGFTFLRLTSAGCNPWQVDKDQYQAFIRDYVGGTGLTIHLSEWQPCLVNQGCLYNFYAWNGLNGNFPLYYEGYYNNRHWWKGTVNNAPDTFNFTLNNTYSWEGGPGQFDRTYNRAAHGNDIYAIGRGNQNVYTTRP